MKGLQCIILKKAAGKRGRDGRDGDCETKIPVLNGADNTFLGTVSQDNYESKSDSSDDARPLYLALSV